mmetsp:Transcript_66882/g.211687  ORF Transcript_66882/g.211687 Transcript_66882/m.211687 type:complete len:201 (-) Transcript_66882:620-1222(-)
MGKEGTSATGAWPSPARSPPTRAPPAPPVPLARTGTWRPRGGLARGGVEPRGPQRYDGATPPPSNHHQSLQVLHQVPGTSTKYQFAPRAAPGGSSRSFPFAPDLFPAVSSLLAVATSGAAEPVVCRADELCSAGAQGRDQGRWNGAAEEAPARNPCCRGPSRSARSTLRCLTCSHALVGSVFRGKPTSDAGLVGSCRPQL